MSGQQTEHNYSWHMVPQVSLSLSLTHTCARTHKNILFLKIQCNDKIILWTFTILPKSDTRGFCSIVNPQKSCFFSWLSSSTLCHVSHVSCCSQGSHKGSKTHTRARAKKKKNHSSSCVRSSCTLRILIWKQKNDQADHSIAARLLHGYQRPWSSHVAATQGSEQSAPFGEFTPPLSSFPCLFKSHCSVNCVCGKYLSSWSRRYPQTSGPSQTSLALRVALSH